MAQLKMAPTDGIRNKKRISDASAAADFED